MLDILSKQHIVAKEGFNRWLIAPAALGIHLCIGSVYAWSLFNPSLIKRLGVVTSAADDWTLKSVVWVFTVAIVFPRTIRRRCRQMAGKSGAAHGGDRRRLVAGVVAS